MWIFDRFGNKVWVANTRVSRLMSRVHKKDGEDGGEGGGGNGGGETEQDRISKAVEAATAAINAKNKELLDENKSAKAIKTEIDALGGFDSIKSLKEFKAKIEQDEILKLAMEGKPQEAIDRALERQKLTYEASIANANTEKESILGELSAAKEKLRVLIVDNAVVRDFVSIKGLESAVPDVLYRARQIFTVENDQPVARDENGDLMKGANGPLTVKEWAESLRKTAPHLFPGSKGSDLYEGSDNPNEFGKALVEAAKKGPEALRKEKARQKAIREKSK